MDSLPPVKEEISENIIQHTLVDRRMGSAYHLIDP
jgi:hypothetical protein